MRRRPRRKRTGGKKLRIFAILALLVFLVFVIDGRLRPAVHGLAEGQAKIIVNQAVNEAVGEELSKENIRYDDLSRIDKDSDGNILAVETDTIQLSALKANLATAIQNKFNEYGQTTIRVPLGNLTGVQMLTGWGPAISIKINMSSSIVTQMVSRFVDAGINQTLHQLVLKIQTSVFILVPGFYTSVEVPSDFIVAETVIVGKVPNAFTQVIGNDGDSMAKINDYGADRTPYGETYGKESNAVTGLE